MADRPGNSRFRTETKIRTTTPDILNEKPLTASAPHDRLVGLVVKASASRAEGPGFESRLRRDFSGVESYL